MPKPRNPSYSGRIEGGRNRGSEFEEHLHCVRHFSASKRCQIRFETLSLPHSMKVKWITGLHASRKSLKIDRPGFDGRNSRGEGLATKKGLRGEVCGRRAREWDAAASQANGRKCRSSCPPSRLCPRHGERSHLQVLFELAGTKKRRPPLFWRIQCSSVLQVLQI